MNADLTPGELGRIEVDARADAKMEDGVTQAYVRALRSPGGLLVLEGKITMNSGLTFTLTVDASGAAEVLS